MFEIRVSRLRCIRRILAARSLILFWSSISLGFDRVFKL